MRAGRVVIMGMVVAVLVLPSQAWGAKAPRVAPPSTYVLDLEADAVRVSERTELVRPIASLTKLMTAMVLLDTRADLERSIAYDPKRHYAYKNWMHFVAGDRLRGRDLLLASLVGSQNIPPRMLVDLTRYAEAEFVAAMNAKAKTLGLTHTAFVDVHGLSPSNVSTASEVAQLLRAGLRYADIRDALGRPSSEVMITSRRGKERVAFFHHTNTILQRRQRFATEASKTGYLHEAGDTIAMLIRDPASGRRFIVVTLGEPRRNPRFAIAKRLSDAAVRSIRAAGSVK
ncbi:MAG: serine hydrolase [bacterium]|nr:serine hydrolase [bacterium]